jgi:RNA polymerase sigma-70 factor (ECF subfamily)
VPDAELVERCRAGDERAWDQLVDRYSRYVYAIAVRAYRLEEHAAEDLFQEVFARMYEHLDRLRDPGALKPWIGQITRRLAIDMLRARRETPGLDEDLIPEQADTTIAEIEEAVAVQQMLGELDQPFAEVLDRFFCRGESYRTIAAALDSPQGTIASRIARGLAQLRTLIEREETGALGPSG